MCVYKSRYVYSFSILLCFYLFAMNFSSLDMQICIIISMLETGLFGCFKTLDLIKNYARVSFLDYVSFLLLLGYK